MCCQPSRICPLRIGTTLARTSAHATPVTDPSDPISYRPLEVDEHQRVVERIGHDRDPTDRDLDRLDQHGSPGADDRREGIRH